MVTVIRDLSSVEKLWKRCLNGLELAADKKINKLLMKLMSYNIRVINKSCRAADIDLADLISRSDELLKPCNADCKVCLDVKANGYLDEQSSRCFFNLESIDYHPARSVERFEEIFNAKNARDVLKELRKSK